MVYWRQSWRDVEAFEGAGLHRGELRIEQQDGAWLFGHGMVLRVGVASSARSERKPVDGQALVGPLGGELGAGCL